MSFLKSVSKGKVRRPYRVMIYGRDGVGKSTFASQAPSPVFIPTENGTDNLDVARGAVVKNLSEVVAALNELITEDHGFKSVVLDHVTGVESLIHKEMVEGDKTAETVMDTKGGFGKGLVFAANQLDIIMPLLDRLREEKNMNIILIGHTVIKEFQDPSTDHPYSRYRLAMDPRAADKLKQWADAVLFATSETLVSKDPKTKKTKAIDARSDGGSIMYTQSRAGWDAKNRYGLPLKIDLNWHAFVQAVEEANPTDTKALHEEIEGLMERINDPDFLAIVKDTIKKSPDDPAFLARIKDKLEIRLQDA